MCIRDRDRGAAIAVRGGHGESHPGGLRSGGDHRALQRRPGAGDRGSAKLPQCLRRRRPGRRHLHGGDPGRADLPWRHIPGDAGSHRGGYLPLCPGFCRRHGISPGRPGGASGHGDGGAAGGGVPHLRGARGDRLYLPGAAAGGASRCLLYTSQFPTSRAGWRWSQPPARTIRSSSTTPTAPTDWRTCSPASRALPRDAPLRSLAAAATGIRPSAPRSVSYTHLYVDGTLGRAGHSREIAKRLTTGRLICIDRDQAAIDAAQERLGPWMDHVTLVHSNFSSLGEVLDQAGVSGADGMLFDLGVSSPQLDDASRGFSYMQDAPLDMRMDKDCLLYTSRCPSGWRRPPPGRRWSGDS